MINVMGKLMNSWYSLIGVTLSVPVYVEGSVPETATNYVELRAESEFENDDKHRFRNDAVIITDIVTKFGMATNRSVAENIDGEIKALIKSSPGVHGLSAQSGMQIIDVVPSDSVYLEEQESGTKYYRKIVRYTHKIVQL